MTPNPAKLPYLSTVQDLSPSDFFTCLQGQVLRLAMPELQDLSDSPQVPTFRQAVDISTGLLVQLHFSRTVAVLPPALLPELFQAPVPASELQSKPGLFASFRELPVGTVFYRPHFPGPWVKSSPVNAYQQAQSVRTIHPIPTDEPLFVPNMENLG